MGGLIARSASPSSGSRADTIWMGIGAEASLAVSAAAETTRTSTGGISPASSL